MDNGALRMHSFPVAAILPMNIQILGPALFACNAAGQLLSKIGTIFPRQGVLVTEPGTHFMQYMLFQEQFNQQRAARGEAPWLPDGPEWAQEPYVALFFEPERIIIRPMPEHMDWIIEADVCLQQAVSKRNLIFQSAQDLRVLGPIKQRGEAWRLSIEPQSKEEMVALIAASKSAILQKTIYYHSRVTGTRYLTSQEFAALAALAPSELALQLQEIADHSFRFNRLQNPELVFFEANLAGFSPRDFTDVNFLALPEKDLRLLHQDLTDRFQAAVQPSFRRDDPADSTWRSRLITRLLDLPDNDVATNGFHGLGSAYFLGVDWLPGGRFEQGEFIPDPVLDGTPSSPAEEDRLKLCETRVRPIILNFMREYGELDYVNVGLVVRPMNTRRPQGDTHREVYIAEVKPVELSEPLPRLIRVIKWGVQERLDEGKPLLQAIFETEEYVDYLLDRRLGCGQLGMKLPPMVHLHRLPETYHGPREEFRNAHIYTYYVERPFVPGTATDKIPNWKYAQDGYALALAKPLGRAAAVNLVVGRTYDRVVSIASDAVKVYLDDTPAERAVHLFSHASIQSLGHGKLRIWQDGQPVGEFDEKFVVFDDGDEVVVEDDRGLPARIVVSDHSGAFDEYLRPLADFAREYAGPVNRRITKVPQPRQFAEAYLQGLRDGLLWIQAEYRKRPGAFDHLFRHCVPNDEGSYADRWKHVLHRLNETDIEALIAAVRRHIVVLT